MWRRGAAALGAKVTEPVPGLLEIQLGRRTTRVQGQTTALADPISAAIAADKLLAYRLLAEAGVAVPEHVVVEVGDRRTGVVFLRAVSAPCIVKPLRGRGGAGVTGEVRTPAQLGRALGRAGRISRQAILERQAPGEHYRALVVAGEVLDVLRRPRPRVVGDGRSTIEDLMFREYERRLAGDGPSGLKEFVADLDCLFTLEFAGLGLGSVLAEGQSAPVKTATNYNGPEDNETVERPYPDSLVEAARRSALALGVRLAGVDIVTTDPARPLAEVDGVVLEVNPVPGLLHHVNVAEPENKTWVATEILRALLGSGSSRRVHG